MVARLVLEESSAFLPGVGASTQLFATALDSNGTPVSARITWTSSAPDQITVDSTGAVTGRTLGSAQVFAEADGVRSLPALVLVAEPVAGALLVADRQVAVIGPPIGLAPGAVPGVGTRYEVTLSGIATPPAPGTALLPSGSAQVGGKVVSSRTEGTNLVVMLEVAPIYELLDRYDFGWSIELAPFLEARAATARQANALSPAAPEPFRPVACKADLEAGLLEKTSSVTPSVDLTLDIFGRKPVAGEPPTYTRRSVSGTFALDGEVSLGFKAGFSAEGECLAQVPIEVPVGGLLSLLVMPQVRIGVGAQVKAELAIAQGKVGLKGKLSTTVSLGFECGGATPDCHAIEDHPVENGLRPIVEIPRLDQMHVALEAQVFAFVGLDAKFFLYLDAPILEGRFGPKQTVDMGFEDDQLTNPQYASSYELALEGEVKPGKALQEAINAVFSGPVAVTFKAKTHAPISHSPTGTLSIDKSTTGPGQPVTITVNVGDLRYIGLGYNLYSVELMKRHEGDLAFAPLASLPPATSGDQATFQYVWTPAERDVGLNEIGALVKTTLDPLIPLEEIAADSLRTVDVKCISATGVTGGVAPPRAGGVCNANWHGTAHVATDLYAADAVATWTPDPTLEVRLGEVGLRATGSMTVDFLGWRNVGCTASPTEFAIGPTANGSVLVIDFSTTPWTYQGGAFETVEYTVDCPGTTPTVLTQGIIWFGGNPGLVDGLRIHDSGSNGPLSFAYDFVKD